MKYLRAGAVASAALAICVAAATAWAQSPGAGLDTRYGPLPDLADVAIRKVGGGVVAVGQSATFTLLVANTGPGPVSNVVVTDVLPSNFGGPLSFTYFGAGWNCVTSGTTADCQYSGPAVGPGARFPTFTISAPAKVPGGFSNCASVQLLGGHDVNPGNNRSCVDGAVRPAASKVDLRITKKGPGPVIAGQTATFTLTPYNVGPTPVGGASGVAVADTLPINFSMPATAVGSGWNCLVSGSGPITVACGYVGPPVGPGSPMPSITITARAKGPGGYVNCASIAVKAGQDANPGNNRGCVGGSVQQAQPYNLSLDKQALDTPWTHPGGGVFRLVVRNVGAGAIPSGQLLTITDILPAEVRFVSATAPWSCNPVGAVGPASIACTYRLGAPLSSGATLSLDIATIFVGEPNKTYDNCARLGMAPPETTLEDNRDCVSVAPFPVGEPPPSFEESGPHGALAIPTTGAARDR